MTIEQKTIELQSVSPPLTRDQIIAELGKWQAEQSTQETEGVLAEKETPEVVENQEPVEEEVVENEEVIEEEGNQEVVAEEQDATVTTTPENASETEDTESLSEDGSLESQEPEEEESYEVIRKRFFDTVQKQKNETSRRNAIDDAVKDAYKDVNSDVEIVKSDEEVVDGDFTYKYVSDVDDEGNLDLQVFYKGKDDEEFINASERAKNNPKNVALQNQVAAIQSQLGFLPAEVKKQANAILNYTPPPTPQDFDPNREGTQSFDDMLLYNYQEEDIRNQMTEADRLVYDSQKKLEVAKNNFNEILESDPEIKAWYEDLKKKMGDYDTQKAEIQKKIDALPMGETGKLAELEQELENLDEKFKDINILKGESMRVALDEELSAMMPDIRAKAYESTIIKPVEEPSLLNIAGKVMRATAKNQPNTATGAIARGLITLTGDIADPVDTDLLQQQEFYEQAKKEYAKKNKVDLNTVTDADVRSIVENKYIQFYTEQETNKLYRNYSESLIENIEKDFFAKYVVSNIPGVGKSLANLTPTFAKMFGFKNIQDIFGDTTQEKKEQLIKAADNLDLNQKIVIDKLAQQTVAAETFKNLGRYNTTYLTEEDAAKAREEIRLSNLTIRSNIDIIEKGFDKMLERVDSVQKSELFDQYYAKNYGFVTELGGRAAASGLDLFVNGLAEYSERMGINVASLGATGIALEGLYNKLTGEDLSKKLTDKFTGSVDSLVEYLNNEMAPPTTLSDIGSGMDVARWAAGSLGQQLPIYGAIYLSGGTYAPILIGAAVAGNKFREMQKEIDLGTADYNWWQMYGAANLTGVSAAATEYVTQGMLNRLKFSYQNIPGFKVSFNETMKGFLSSTGRWARDMGEEIPSEMLDELIGNIGDKYILGKKDVNLFDNLGETALSTLWTAGVAIRAPLIGHQLLAPFRSKQSYQTIGEGVARISELNEQLATNKNLSVEAVQKIKDEISAISVNNMKALKTDINRLDDLTGDEKKILLNNKAKEYEIIRSIQEINNDNTIDQKTKETLINSKKQELQGISTNSTQILAPYIIAENKAKNEPIIDEAIKNVEQVTKKVLGESINVIDDMNNLPEGIPKFVDAYVDPKTNQIYINKEWAASVGAVTAAEHELLHKIQKSLFDTNPAKALELVEDFKKTLGKRELRLIEERLDANYRFKMDDEGNFILDENGNKQKKEEIEYAEEYFNIFSDLVGKKEIGFTDNLGENLLRFVNKLKELVYKPAGFKNLEYQSGRDAYNFIKDYNKSIKKGEVSERGEALIRKGTTTTRDRTSTSITTRGQEFINLSKEGVYDNESLVEIVNSPSSNQTDRFAAMEAIVETNWPVISKGLKFNPTGSIPMDAVKTAVTEQMQGIFPGRNKELLADFNAETAQVNTYLGSLMRQRQAEILERAKQIGGTLQEGTSIDSEAAKQVVDTSKSRSKTKDSRVAKKPTETVKYSDTFIKKAGVKDKVELEAKITEETRKGFEDVEVERFGQTKDVPRGVADIYGDMLGLNPETITDKTRTYQNYDEAGLNAAQRFLLTNAASDFSRLPKTKDETTTRGRGTFIPKNMKDALYTDGRLTGTLKDYMDLLRSKPTGKLYRDSKYAQLIRGLLNTHIRNRMFETLVDTTPKRLRGGAKFSITQAQRPGVYTAALGEQGVKVMRTSAEKFAKDNNIKVEFEGEELTVNNFKATNPKAVEYLKRNIENEMWKYIPLESLTRGTMIDYSSKGNAIFFNSEQFDNILKNAEKNRKAWLDQGNTLSYNVKEVNVAKAAKSPSVVSNRYSTPAAQRKVNDNYKGVEAILQGGANAIKADPANYLSLLAIYGTQSVSTSHLVRNMAVDKGVSEEYIKAKRDKSGKTVKEHVDPSNDMSSLMYTAQLYDDVDFLMPVVEKVYFQLGITETQDNKLVDTDGKYGESYNYKETQTQFFYDELKEYFKTGDVSKIPNALVRYFNPQVNRNSSGDGIQGLNSNNFYIMGKSVAEMFTRQLPKSDQNSNNIYVQNELTYQVMTGEITQAEAIKRLDAQISSGNAKIKPSITNNNMQPNSLKFSDKAAGNSVLVTDELNTLDKALAEGRKVDKPVKKIRVFDFDDTLAKSNSKVIVINPLSSIDSDMLDIVARRKFKKEFENLPSFKQNFNSLNEQQKLEVLKEVPGGTKEINATQFAEQAATLEEQGAKFDFSQFEQVIDGEKGPLFDVAKKIADTRGTEDLFILTARPQSAAGPIKAFMKALGINIPLGNITGLSDGTAAAKGRWIAGKASEGYNDFYFADDASKNVKAVKDVLDQIDVKSRVQQAKFSKTSTFDTIINQMIEDSSGIESFKQFSAAKAKTVGRDKGRFDWLTMASSAEDFKGLLYSLLGNGKKGEAQYEFLKTNLIDPYNKAEDSITQAKIAAANDFMALKEQFPGLPKTLETETGVGKFTYQHALRTYMWTQQGMSIPGLSKTDVGKLNKFITDDAKLQAFADQLMSIQKGKPYPKPGKDWLGGNLTTDIIGGINDVNRKEYQQEFRENVDIIFSPENLNKMEAAYGTRWRKALENTLTRMKAGTNRLGYNDQTSAVLDWVNNSVGAVMFLNTRSALLQTISAVNFINWGDNNIIAAGKAFANQKQFWGDFMTLMNSDYLVQRRNGLKINVSESEIADAVKDSKNKVNAAISYLLSKGFVLTRYADSFAIASGGSTFYRNRINKYIKEGMSKELATEKAFQDFRLIAEESQQSSSPDKISMQQASAAGRVILNWANTPMQYVRIQKRAIQDLIAGRGDAKVHMSRIAYYGVMQNLIFNAMQQALFAIGFGDDEDDEEKSAAKKKQDNKKIARVANGMIDSQLKGLGIAGAGMVAVKNTLMKIYEESGKKRPEYEKAAIEALSFSPAISSKYRKIVGGLKSFSWNMKEMKQKGFSLDNPAYLAGAQIITATTNIPIDRVIKKANNIRGILSEQSQMWQKVILFGGWSTWDVGLPYYGGWDKPVEPTPAELKRQEIDVMKRDTSTTEQTQMLLDLGLDKKQIKALRYEDARVKKIIELQNKNKEK